MRKKGKSPGKKKGPLRLTMEIRRREMRSRGAIRVRNSLPPNSDYRSKDLDKAEALS